MDTKMQNLPITHAQNHRSSRHHSHNCRQCCGRHRHSCSRSSSQGPASHCSLPGHRSPTNHRCPPVHHSQSPSSSLSPRHHKHTTYCKYSSMQPATHYCTSPKKRKILRGKVKRKVKRNRQVHKTKRQSSGRKSN